MDVLVRGAGPAGCTAARHRAEAGLEVVLVDRRRPDGDHPVLIERTVAPVSTTAVARLTLSFGDEPPRHFDDPGIVITSYDSLVTALRESAVAAGTDVTPDAPANATSRPWPPRVASPAPRSTAPAYV